MPFQCSPLYPILDASFLPAQDRDAFLIRLVSELADAGIALLQYRNKLDRDEQVMADAAAIKQTAAGRITLIMNDSPELAVRAGFDGVHIGQQDVSPAAARAIVGLNRIVGVSTHNRAQLDDAARQSVDYIAIGPVFATATKENPDPVVGLDGVREARVFINKPLVAIGGITLENAGAVLDAGADSIAVISALFGPGRNSAEIARDFLRISSRRS